MRFYELFTDCNTLFNPSDTELNILVDARI